MALKSCCEILIAVVVVNLVIVANAVPSPILDGFDGSDEIQQQQQNHEQALSGRTQSRSKRSLINFSSMIKCGVPGVNSHATVTALYGSYGCWCGVGGKGKTVDAIDKCCKNHDKCYGRVSSCGPKVIPYLWKCKKSKPSCTRKAKYWYEYFGYNTSCMKKVCDCDRAAVLCFKKHHSSYSLANVNIGLTKC
eukprot:scpid59491/ scgid13584/ Phospholipase A2 PC17; Phosphatidylcholine 2-acylhydrolase